MICCCLILEQLKQLQGILVYEFRNCSLDVKDLYGFGILPKQSYIAISIIFSTVLPKVARLKMVNLLFEELIDPSVYSKFKAYCRKRSLESLTC